MSKPIFVLGAAITDMMGFPLGKPMPTDSVPGVVTKAPGGVGRNLAENLVRLGLNVELITAFGDDKDGRALLQNCQDLNIGVRHSILADGHKGAIHLAVLDERKDLYAGVADLSVLSVLSPAYMEQQKTAIEQSEALCLETNTSPEVIDWLLAQEWEIPLYLDPVSTHLASRIQSQIGRFHTVKANRRQAEILTGGRVLNLEDMKAAAAKLLDRGVQRVFITLGSQGAFAANQQQAVHLAAAKVTVANTTGAGDAFQAGVLWASRRKWSLEDCCRAGLAASTIAVRSELATSPDLSEATLLEYIRKFC